MADLFLEFVVPAILHALRFTGRLVAEIFIEGVVIRLWRWFRCRELRAEARGWLAEGDWAAFTARFDAGSKVERQQLLVLGGGRPELAEIYALALNGDWAEAMPAVSALRRQPQLPPAVERAARLQLELGGMRAELVRPLKLRQGPATAATAAAEA